MHRDRKNFFKQELDNVLEQIVDLEEFPSKADKRKVIDSLFEVMLEVENL